MGKTMDSVNFSSLQAPPCLDAPANARSVLVKPVTGGTLEIDVEAGGIMTVGHLKDEICARGGAPPEVVTLLAGGRPLADDDLLPTDGNKEFAELQLQYFLKGGGSGMGSGGMGKGGGFEMLPFGSWKEGFCWFRCLCQGFGCDCPSTKGLLDPLQKGKYCCIQSQCSITGLPDLKSDNWCEDKCLCEKSECGPKACKTPFQLLCLKFSM